MRLNAALLGAATAAADAACAFTHPADAVLREFFRAHHELGSHDRAFVADTVFAVLRHKRLLEAIVPEPTPRRLVIASVVKFQGISIGALEAFIDPEDKQWLVSVKQADIERLPMPVRLSAPEWMWERLLAQMSETDAVALGRSLLTPAPLDLRVNTLVATRDDVMKSLTASGFEPEPTVYSPVGIRLKGKPAINRHPLFLRGAVEVQDEGSQLLGFLAAPKRREMVVDFCAGAGGKTLLMGALMQNQGRLYAFDVSEKRLSELKPRLKRSGLSNVHAQLIASENDPKVKRLSGKIDCVLVDAPCSGLGTLRRNPDIKWRQSIEGVGELVAKQRSILAASAQLLKPGGRLVYATCSLLREENEDIVEEFVAASPGYNFADPQQIIDAQRINAESGRFFRLFPHRHGCDGFFAAVIERKANA